MKKIKIIGTLSIAMFLVLLGISIEQSCAETPKKIKLIFMNNWSPSIAWAPFWSAQRRFWPEENIEGEVRDGTGGADTVKAVAAGSAKAGYVNIDALHAIQKGLPITIVAAGDQNTACMLYTLKRSGIKSLKDLEGRRVGQYPFSSTLSPMSKAMLKKQNVDLSKINFINSRPGQGPTMLIGNKLDASLGMVGCQDVRLRAQGYETTTFPFKDYGLDLYGYLLIVNKEWETKIGHDGMVRFLRGVAKGFLLWKTDIEKSVDDIIYYRDMQKAKRKTHLSEYWAHRPRHSSPDLDKHGWGVITEEKLRRTENILFNIGFLKKKIDIKEYYNISYLMDPSVQKIAKKFVSTPIDPKAKEYYDAVTKK